MSTWTNERHEAARARCEAATDGPWESCGGTIEGGPTSGRDVVTTEVDCMSYCYGGTGRGVEHPEDREFIAHARIDLPALLDEIERLRALTTITDDMVRAAAREIWLSGTKDRAWAEAAWDDMGGSEPCEERALVEIAAERVLEAALNPKENEA